VPHDTVVSVPQDPLDSVAQQYGAPVPPAPANGHMRSVVVRSGVAPPVQDWPFVPDGHTTVLSAEQVGAGGVGQQ
jgi:hypothetical protein